MSKNIEIRINTNGTDYEVLYPKTSGTLLDGIVPVSNGGTGVNNYYSLANNLVDYMTLGATVETGSYIGTSEDIPSTMIEAREAYISIIFPKGRPSQLFIFPKDNEDTMAMFLNGVSDNSYGIGLRFCQPLMKIGETHTQAYAARYITYSWMLQTKWRLVTNDGIVNPASNQVLITLSNNTFLYYTNNTSQTVKPDYSTALFFNWKGREYKWVGVYY